MAIPQDFPPIYLQEESARKKSASPKKDFFSTFQNLQGPKKTFLGL
jgi:hypothetical protein